MESNSKNTYVIGNSSDPIIRTKYAGNEEYMDMILEYSKEWVNETINKLNLNLLPEKVAEAYVGLGVHESMNMYSEDFNKNSIISIICYDYENMRSFFCGDRTLEIKNNIHKRFKNEMNYSYNNKICFFVDVTNKFNNKNTIVPLTTKGLFCLIGLIFSDRFINEGNEDIANSNNSANLLYFKDRDNSFVTPGGYNTDSTLSNALDALCIQSQEDIKDIVVNKIVDVGPMDTRSMGKRLTLKPRRVQCNIVDEELIRKVSDDESENENTTVSFNESLGLYKEIGIDLLEVTGVSNDLLSILNNEYETFKTIRRLNMLDNCNRWGDVSFNSQPLLDECLKFYCKACRKNSMIPAIVTIKNEVNNQIKCPICGEFHTIGNNDELERTYFLNATVFDEIETEGKIRFRTRCCSYSESHSGIYYKSVSQGFTYNIKTNRAFLFNGANKSGYRVSDISAFNVNYLSEFAAVSARNAFRTDSEGNTIVKLDKFKKCFYNVYDLLYSHMDIKFSEEEILEMSMNNLRNAKSLVDSDLIVAPLLSTSTERNNTVDKINDERMYFNAIKMLGEILKDSTKSKEYYEVIGVSSNYLVNYIHKASQRNGKYLTNKFGVSNSIRKELIKRPWKITNYILFREAITDVNNMKKLFDLDINNEYMTRIVSSFADTMEDGKSWCKSLKMLDFISKKFGDLIMPLKGLYKDESTFVNRLLTNSLDDIVHYLNDTCRMLVTVQSGNAVFNFNSKFKIKRLHDELSSAERKLKKVDKLITLDEYEETLECSNERYTISLARNTHRLIDLGVNLNICVGSYDTRAVNKDCTILYVTDKFNKNKDLCCIEVRRPVSSYIEGAKVRFDLYQTKTYSNNRPTNELRDFLLGWVKENKINISTTYDIEFGDECILKDEGDLVPVQYYNNDIINF